jgi:hypothetical protein
MVASSLRSYGIGTFTVPFVDHVDTSHQREQTGGYELLMQNFERPFSSLETTPYPTLSISLVTKVCLYFVTQDSHRLSGFLRRAYKPTHNIGWEQSISSVSGSSSGHLKFSIDNGIYQGHRRLCRSHPIPSAVYDVQVHSPHVLSR